MFTIIRFFYGSNHRYTSISEGSVCAQSALHGNGQRPRGHKKDFVENPHLHISEKKIHEGIFMFVKQSGEKRAEREGTRKRFFGSSLLMFIFFQPPKWKTGFRLDLASWRWSLFGNRNHLERKAKAVARGEPNGFLERIRSETVGQTESDAHVKLRSSSSGLSNENPRKGLEVAQLHDFKKVLMLGDPLGHSQDSTVLRVKGKPRVASSPLA